MHAVDIEPWLPSFARKARHRFQQQVVRPLAAGAIIGRTNNYATVRWLGRPMWQNVTDAFLLQETIVDVDVDLVVECGTHQGGSAFYMATIFDLLGRGEVITIDVDDLVDFDQDRVTFLRGSSTDPAIVDDVHRRVSASASKRVMVVLDSDHRAPHVLAEMHAYADLVTIGSYLYVQDGNIDEFRILRGGRPGPLRAIEQFLAEDDRFEVDAERCERYLIGHSPSGWLRRVR